LKPHPTQTSKNQHYGNWASENDFFFKETKENAEGGYAAEDEESSFCGKPFV
tara:strand:- start:97 stop:252 length:156 start_codon:yes stop_codon:yes gene_type:complete